MIQPAFHRQRIAEYAKAMVFYGEQMRDEWQTGEVRDIDREMMRLTLQIVGKTLFNSDVNDEADEVGKSMTTLIELFNYLLICRFPNGLKNYRCRNRNALTQHATL